jgi:transcriptional regulator with XRE-family HTH domain
METPIFLLRKALGLTQQQMAERLDCGFSTLQGYEAGRKLSPDIRERAVRIAHEHSLESLAHLLATASAEGELKTGRYNPENRRWHDMLEAILESKDPQALAAVKPNITLFYAWVKKISKNFR